MRNYLTVFYLLFTLLLNADSLAIPESQVMQSLEKHIHPNQSGNKIGKIVIDDRSSGINQGTWLYVKSALDYYRKNPPLFVILELNTPGGEVFSAQKISDALKEIDIQNDIPVVAYINNWAISAGAMLAYSSRYIAVVKDGSMGAAEPVLQDAASGEMKTASEKVNSALRADFANRASFFGRNPYIAEAMVDKDIILVLREGKIIKVDLESQVRPDDTVISPKGKLLTLNALELIDYGVADISLQPVKTSQLNVEEPLFQYPFFASIKDAVIDEYQMDWKTKFFVLLAHPMVASALMLGLMFGLYMEFSNPGFGLPGIIALGCLFLLGLSSFSLEIGDWLEVILLLTGLALLLVDLFLLPTFGIAGFIGLLLFLTGLAGLLLPGIGSIDFEFDTKTFNAAGVAFFNRLMWLLGTFFAGIIGILLLARYVVPHAKTFKKFVLEGGEQAGYQAVNIESLPKTGTIGEVIADLRPAGKVMIDGNSYDAISTGRYIGKKSQIIVVGSSEGQLTVKEL